MMRISPSLAQSVTAFAALLCLGTVSPAYSQELSWAEKMFEMHKVDFGTVARGADTRLRVKITNIYKEDVHISDVRTTCGCSAAKPSATTLHSREEAYVEITMDTRRFTRRKDSNLIVTFDAPLAAEVRLPITAYIRTDVVLTPGSVNFGTVDLGTEQQKQIQVAYAGRDDWQIRGVQNDDPNLQVAVKETVRTSGRVEYTVDFHLLPTAAAGPYRHHIQLLTDDANAPTVPVLVEARIESDITITPDVVSLGMLVPGQQKTVNVVIRGKQPFKVEKIECNEMDRCFKVRLPEESRQVHVLPLTITTPEDQQGSFTEVFSVQVAGRPEPVVFKASGKIIDAGKGS